MTYKYVRIAKEDTYALIERAKGGDDLAREQIVNQNTGLVKNIALKFINTGHELDDLLQIGFIGLLKAIDRFDPSFDVMFSTYAVPMIMGEIKRFIRDDGRIKMSRQLKLDIKNMKLAQEEYYNKCGIYPKLSELAELLEVTVERVLEIMEARDTITNVESLDNEDRPEEVLNMRSQGKSTEDAAVDMIYLKTIIGKLSDKERQVIVLRYFKDMTQQQIAGRLGISQVQVSRIEKRVLQNIRAELVE